MLNFHIIMQKLIIMHLIMQIRHIMINLHIIMLKLMIMHIII